MHGVRLPIVSGRLWCYLPARRWSIHQIQLEHMTKETCSRYTIIISIYFLPAELSPTTTIFMSDWFIAMLHGKRGSLPLVFYCCSFLVTSYQIPFPEWKESLAYNCPSLLSSPFQPETSSIFLVTTSLWQPRAIFQWGWYLGGFEGAPSSLAGRSRPDPPGRPSFPICPTKALSNGYRCSMRVSYED